MAMRNALIDEMPAVTVRMSDPNILSIREFGILASEMKFKYVNLHNGSIDQSSAKDWILGVHMNYAAVIHGPPQVGKTPLAKSLAATVAPIYAKYHTTEYAEGGNG